MHILAAALLLYSVQADRSLLRYNIVHKLHEVSAEGKQIEGKVALKPDGTAQVMVRALVASFRSGDGNRDEHMQETMEGQKFPYVVFKGLTRFPPPAAYPASVDVVLEGELEFHGEKRRERFPIKVEMPSAGVIHATGTLHVSLEAYKIERPSLLLVPVDDDCAVQLDLVLQQDH